MALQPVYQAVSITGSKVVQVISLLTWLTCQFDDLSSHTYAIHIFLQWSNDCVLTVYTVFSNTSRPATLASLLYLAPAVIELFCTCLTAEWKPNAFHQGHRQWCWQPAPKKRGKKMIKWWRLTCKFWALVSVSLLPRVLLLNAPN